jgi:transposase-like protein
MWDCDRDVAIEPAMKPECPYCDSVRSLERVGSQAADGRQLYVCSSCAKTVVVTRLTHEETKVR